MALTVACLVSACSSGSGSGAKPAAANGAGPIPPPSIGPLATDPTQPVALPLDAYLQSDSDGSTLAKAQNLLITACMKQKGFVYQAQPSTSTSAPTTGINDPNYGLSSDVGVDQYGYHASASQIASKLLPYSIHDQYSNAYLQALYGTSDLQSSAPHGPGCVDDAAKRLAQGSGSYDQNIVGEVAQDAANRTVSDSRMVSATSAWSSCMSAKGFDYKTPADPAKKFAASINAPTAGASASVPLASSLEIATAQADLACKSQLKLAQLWTAIEAGYQNEYIEKNQTALAAYRDALTSRVQRAAAVVAGHAGS